MHTRASLCAPHFFSPSKGRRAKEKKRRKGEAAIVVTGASNQASERCRYILYWTRKIEQQG